jgi:hypothetical protein
MVDRRGAPVSIIISKANVHDSKLKPSDGQLKELYHGFIILGL